MYRTDTDAEAAHQIGRAFGELEGKAGVSCSSGWVATCARAPPSSPQAIARGLPPEGATVLDAGEIGTEMFYCLVGSRELDGG